MARPSAGELIVALDVLVNACPLPTASLTTRELAIAAVAAETARQAHRPHEDPGYALAIVRESAELVIRDDARAVLRPR